MRRREFIASGLALPMAWSTQSRGQAPVYLSDMHFHSFFGQSTNHSRPVAKTMAAGNATLVAWSLGGDILWFDTKDKYRQHSVPAPGAALGWFQRELGRIKAHIAEEKLKIALTPADVDKALQGEPHIVLAVEGATFVEDPSGVQIAWDAGVRHLQLVHYIKSPLGDFQTSPPVHQGLTELGKKVVAECNRLGMLVDLAHCTPATIAGALAISQVPMIFSHGSVTNGPRPHPGLITWKARQLAVEHARTMTRAGGVIGLWALSVDIGATFEDYAARMLQLADWLGDEHVAFGTDINGLGRQATVTNYADVRRVVEVWQRQGVPEPRIRRIASENYGRMLKRAMQARRA